MKVPAEFDEVRPYNPEELPQVFDELLSDPSFQAVVSHVMPGVPLELIARRLRACRTNLDVQKAFFHRLLHDIMDKCSDGFTMDTRSVTDHTRNYTFVSNHRDIVLDPGFLSVGLIDNGFPTTVEIAIGDNLLIYPWIRTLVRLNKAFIVRRNISRRELYESSLLMSRYMHHAINVKHENIWIAQREGRAKDSSDQTQISLLKMLTLSGTEGTEGAEKTENTESLMESIRQLNIVPLSISYEYDPCDYLKAQEFQQKRDDAGWKKSKQDDLMNMKTGIFGKKGHVHYQTGRPVNTWIDELAGMPEKDFYTELAQRIDREIHRNYRLFPGNYVATDLLSGKPTHATYYTHKELVAFEQYIASRIALINLPNKDEAFLRERLLTMYANPVINYEAAR